MKKSIVGVLFAVLFSSYPAFGYPTAVVFSPTGEAHNFGNIGFLAYTGTNFRPKISPGSTWAGTEVGILPQWGSSDVKFGGLETGFDIFTPDAKGRVKPVLNAKLGLVTEGFYSPSLAIGLMEISPALPSMNFGYTSATKTLKLKSGVSLGRLTLGLGGNLGNRAQFEGTWPFKTRAKLSLMAAYETPLIQDKVGFQIDHLGGDSEISSTYIGALVGLTSNTSFGLGGFASNNRNHPADGMFGFLTTNIDLR